MNDLDAHDRELARRTAPSEKLAQALESMRVGFRLKRASLRRQFPDADEKEINRLLAEWLRRDGDD